MRSEMESIRNSPKKLQPKQSNTYIDSDHSSRSEQTTNRSEQTTNRGEQPPRTEQNLRTSKNMETSERRGQKSTNIPIPDIYDFHENQARQELERNLGKSRGELLVALNEVSAHHLPMPSLC